MPGALRTRFRPDTESESAMNRFLLAVAMIVGVSVSAMAFPGSAAPREHGPTRLHAATSLRPPTLAVQRRSSRDAPGYIFVAPKGGRTQGPEIFDEGGRPVWFNSVGGGDEADDFRVQSYQGAPVLTWWQGDGFGGLSQGADYIADGSYKVVATVHAGNGLQADGHEFQLTPQGTALITAYHAVPYDLSSVGGPSSGQAIDGVVQEIDIATGQVLFEWHSLDHVPLTDSYQPVESPYDYFHLNSVSLDNDGNLLISGRHTWTIYKVDRHSGQVIWRLGGKRSSFSLPPNAVFAWQHNALAAGANTIRIFDNERNDAGPVMPPSRVIWLQLDLATMSATLARAITHPNGWSASSQGNAQAVDKGDTIVGWGDAGRLSEFDPQGGLLFDALLPGAQTYRAYRFGWSAQPTTRPTASGRHHGRGRRVKSTIHAIWNGATSVVRWRILAGPSARRLRAVRTVSWNGLDTQATIPGAPRVVAVVALGSGGHIVGRSKPTSVR
jgi:Arylsulfotransferase (ASST)